MFYHKKWQAHSQTCHRDPSMRTHSHLSCLFSCSLHNWLQLITSFVINVWNYRIIVLFLPCSWNIDHTICTCNISLIHVHSWHHIFLLGKANYELYSISVGSKLKLLHNWFLITKVVTTVNQFCNKFITFLVYYKIGCNC